MSQNQYTYEQLEDLLAFWSEEQPQQFEKIFEQWQQKRGVKRARSEEDEDDDQQQLEDELEEQRSAKKPRLSGRRREPLPDWVILSVCGFLQISADFDSPESRSICMLNKHYYNNRYRIANQLTIKTHKDILFAAYHLSKEQVGQHFKGKGWAISKHSLTRFFKDRQNDSGVNGQLAPLNTLILKASLIFHGADAVLLQQVLDAYKYLWENHLGPLLPEVTTLYMWPNALPPVTFSARRMVELPKPENVDEHYKDNEAMRKLVEKHPEDLKDQRTLEDMIKKHKPDAIVGQYMSYSRRYKNPVAILGQFTNLSNLHITSSIYYYSPLLWLVLPRKMNQLVFHEQSKGGYNGYAVHYSSSIVGSLEFIRKIDPRFKNVSSSGYQSLYIMDMEQFGMDYFDIIGWDADAPVSYDAPSFKKIVFMQPRMRVITSYTKMLTLAVNYVNNVEKAMRSSHTNVSPIDVEKIIFYQPDTNTRTMNCILNRKLTKVKLSQSDRVYPIHIVQPNVSNGVDVSNDDV